MSRSPGRVVLDHLDRLQPPAALGHHLEAREGGRQCELGQALSLLSTQLLGAPARLRRENRVQLNQTHITARAFPAPT